ncbi:MAG: DNA polymerase [Parachlamydiaceae bacterium]
MNLKRRLNLVELAEKVGLVPRLAASTQNGEYHSACPLCGGNDRFIIQPNRLSRNGTLGCFLCRQCKTSGNSVKFCMNFLKMHKSEASLIVQLPSNEMPKSALPCNREKPIALNSLWMDWAKDFCNESHSYLMQAPKAQELTKARGLTLETAEKYLLGYCSKDQWIDRKLLGLPSLENGSNKLYLPEGLVIPYIKEEQVIKIKMRRTKWKPDDKYAKYQIIPGSQSTPLLFGSNYLPIVVVEAELDAMLLSQEAGDICSVLATGGASNYLDANTDKFLKQAPLILFALDFDEAGKKAFIHWRSAYPKVCPWPAPYAKSPADAFLARINLRAWVNSGIQKYSEKKEPYLQLAVPNFHPLMVETVEQLPLVQSITLEIKSSNTQKAALEDIHIEYIETEEQALKAVASLLSSQQIFGLDIETTKMQELRADKQAGLDPKKSWIRTVQIFDGNNTVFIFDVRKLKNLSLLDSLIGRPMLAHNAIFEMKHLLHHGLALKKLGCTLLADRVLHGDRRELKAELGLATTASLKDLAKELLGLEISKEMQTSDWSQEELSKEQLEYAAIDAVLPVKLFAIQWKQLQQRGLVRAYRLLRDAQYPIARMELTGIGFNVTQHQQFIIAWEKERVIIEAEILEVIGTLLNINSSKQLSKWLQEALKQKDLETWTRTVKGQLSTSTYTFRLNEGMHDIFPKIVKYRQLAKLISSFGQGLYKFIDAPNNRLYGSFFLGNTSTGRMSSYNPNMQNMPKGEFRTLFCAKEGCTLIGLDYSQQELRVAAMVTQDVELLRIYLEGGDVHINTASSLLKFPKESIGKEQRQLAKAVIFGLLYGQGANGLTRYAKQQYSVEMSLEEATNHREGFFKTYAGLRKWQQQTGSAAEYSRKVRTPCGRERDFSRERLGYRYTAALNLPIQGAAAEITLHALIRLIPFLSKECQLVNVIHDEILLEVADDKVHEFIEKAVNAMEEAFIDVFPTSKPYLKGLVEAKYGKTWAETK